ncbi:MAG: UDP-N-acetylmuramoyl-L-alanyl-D-glutamate--2,6-diaminopimelate ligase, partial [Desulfobacterales bacterium CG23_combo_of_CG06-09_8_20_14_all_52_9]
PRGRALLEQFPRSGIGVGFDPENAIWAKIVKSDLSGIQAMVHTPAGPFEASSPLVGLHNLENMLCATGAGFALGLSLETIRGGLEAVTRVPGRFETVPDAAGRHVVIDFAHTPDALENTLKAIRALNPGRVITVFGCGGNRDREKRPLMGEIAGRLSDWVIITSDNPRNEDPNAIIEQIRKGVIRSCPKEGDSIKDVGTVHNVFWIEPDRRSAIRIGIRAARPGDAVLIAGKGHETYQIRGDETVHFDDREEAMAALSLKEREGSVQ